MIIKSDGTHEGRIEAFIEQQMKFVGEDLLIIVAFKTGCSPHLSSIYMREKTKFAGIKRADLKWFI